MTVTSTTEDGWVSIPVSVIQTIIDQIPTCVCLKHEDWPGLSKITALRTASETPGKRRISILCSPSPWL